MMKRIGNPFLLLPSAIVLILALAAWAAGPEAPRANVMLQGIVAHPGPVDAQATGGLPTYRRLVKIGGSGNQYRCTLEVEGYALRDILDRADIKKASDDGFNRPLDTLILVKGRTQASALLSYGEVFLAGDGGPLLVNKARLVLPHHHAPLPKGSDDPTVFRSAEERSRLALPSCASCHAGPEPPALSLPKGWLLVVPQDGFGGRFVEDVTEIAVRQVGITVQEKKDNAAKALIEEPLLVAPDGAQTPLTPERVRRASPQSWKDATFGEGRGFRGILQWQGANLDEILRPLLPAGVNPRDVWVLVTAADGYRSVFSGSEVFAAPEGRGLLLADRVDGATQGPGSGRYHVLPRADFYLDRSVRMVKEIRLGLVKP